MPKWVVSPGGNPGLPRTAMHYHSKPQDAQPGALYDTAAETPCIIGGLFLATCFGLMGWAALVALVRYVAGVAS